MVLKMDVENHPNLRKGKVEKRSGPNFRPLRTVATTVALRVRQLNEPEFQPF